MMKNARKLFCLFWESVYLIGVYGRERKGEKMVKERDRVKRDRDMKRRITNRIMMIRQG